MENTLFADVIVDITLEKLNHTFQYIVPHTMEKISIGDRVVVPFSRREIEGIIISLSTEPKVAKEKLKEIIKKSSEEPEDKKLIQLAAWMSDYFGATLNQTLKTVFPSKHNITPYEKKLIKINEDEEFVKAYKKKLMLRKNHSIGKERLINELLKEKKLQWDIVVNNLHVQSSTIRELEKIKILQVERYRTYRNPVGNEENLEVKPKLNEEQKEAVYTILNKDYGLDSIEDHRKDYGSDSIEDYRKDYESDAIEDHRKDYESDSIEKKKKPYLLFGITGSGKTEVYLEVIEENLRRGKDAIVLIPEISLTYQTVKRFYKRFGDKVSFIHSRMSQNEKWDQIERAKRGDVKIIIGPRSAIFTPFKNLGLIIVDEEHETSYKSSNAPRYHAVDVAIKRGELSNATVILGTATPSVETFFNAKNGTYHLLNLTKRALSRTLPEVSITDLRDELKRGNRSIFGKELFYSIKDCLKRNEQCMLFLNRRGIMGTVLCRSCGHVIKCDHCDVPMTLHYDKLLHCHYCASTKNNPTSCEDCHSTLIGTMRAGTEYVEKEVKKIFPEAKILRMDRDTVTKKGDYEKILSAFHNREADILIGTQMIVKGHDFSNVTLMGILAADLSLNVSNFRASERTFDLLVQAAGRSGRGEKKGKVIIQTYNPTNYAILNAAKQDYISFYNEEIKYRRMLNYPPFGHLLKILFESKKLNSLEAYAKEAAKFLSENYANKIPKLTILGPEDDMISKINDVYRKAIYIKSSQYDKIISVRKDFSKNFIEEKSTNDVVLWFDFDPQ